MRKPGADAVIITWATMVRVALEAAQLLESEGLQVGVLDLRWLAPLDEEAIRTGRDTRKRRAHGLRRPACRKSFCPTLSASPTRCEPS